MGSSAKKQRPSVAERASAGVALDEYYYFKKNYGPLLRRMRDQSLTADIKTTLRGRAGADTMQALTGEPSYEQTQELGRAGSSAQAYQGQLAVAGTSAKDVQNKMQTNVLGIARGQAADAQTGMAKASRLATSEALTRAKAKSDVSLAKRAAAAQVATTFVMQGIDNMKGGGSFLSPSGESMSAGDRLRASGFFGQKTADSSTFKPGSKQWRDQEKLDTSYDPMLDPNFNYRNPYNKG